MTITEQLIEALEKSTVALKYLRDAVPSTMLRALNNNIVINEAALSRAQELDPK